MFLEHIAIVAPGTAAIASWMASALDWSSNPLSRLLV